MYITFNYWIMSEKVNITVQVTVNVPVEKAWECWTEPRHITKWNFATEDWKCPSAKNDLRVGGQFSSRMEAEDGSMGFDFSGVYTNVEASKNIEYRIDDGRLVSIVFHDLGGQTRIVETFEAENKYPVEMQQAGWQAIMDNYKKHVESIK